MYAALMSNSNPHGEDKIEFKILDYSAVGSDTVVFKLEDQTIVKVKVSIERVGVATNYRNPDGSPHYAVNTSVKLYVVPFDKKFAIPKSQVGIQTPDMAGRETPSHIA
jgi:hypothetical protein